MKTEKKNIYILLVDITYIYVYYNSERNGFSFKAKWFSRRHRTKERKEKKKYIIC
jgi:hypothetical protein